MSEKGEAGGTGAFLEWEKALVLGQVPTQQSCFLFPRASRLEPAPRCGGEPVRLHTDAISRPPAVASPRLRHLRASPCVGRGRAPPSARAEPGLCADPQGNASPAPRLWSARGSGRWHPGDRGSESARFETRGVGRCMFLLASPCALPRRPFGGRL